MTRAPSVTSGSTIATTSWRTSTKNGTFTPSVQLEASKPLSPPRTRWLQPLPSVAPQKSQLSRPLPTGRSETSSTRTTSRCLRGSNAIWPRWSKDAACPFSKTLPNFAMLLTSTQCLSSASSESPGSKCSDSK